MDYRNKKLVFMGCGTDVLDPKKGPAIRAQLQDELRTLDSTPVEKVESSLGNPNAGVMLPDPKDLDPTASVDPEWLKMHWRDVTADVAAGKSTAFDGLAAIQIIGGVRPPVAKGKEPHHD